MANFRKTLRGAFLAVSKPIFPSEYSFESSWRNLQSLHTKGLHLMRLLEKRTDTLLHRSEFKIQLNVVKQFHFSHFIFKILLFYAIVVQNSLMRLKFTVWHCQDFLRRTPGEDQCILDSSQNSRDFAKNIVNLLEMCFQHVIKTLEKS